jgi:hypothetical protein
MLRLINELSNIVMHMLVDVNMFPIGYANRLLFQLKQIQRLMIQPSDLRAKNGWRDPSCFYYWRDLSPALSQ